MSAVSFYSLTDALRCFHALNIFPILHIHAVGASTLAQLQSCFFPVMFYHVSLELCLVPHTYTKDIVNSRISIDIENDILYDN